MTDTPYPDLEKLQRWMQSVIMHPGGVIAAMQSDESRQHIDVVPADIESVILPSQAVSSVDRLEIYARAYYARLLECLQAEFPVMVMAMGEKLFGEFAVAYLQRYPSRSYTLDHLGRDFAVYLSETRQEAGGDADAWLDFLADLARLEWNIAEVFDGPGVENQSLLEIDQLQSVAAERWGEARLVTVPCLRLLRFDFPVDDYYRSLHEGNEAAPPDRGETFVAMSRRNYVVRHYRLSGPEHAILAALILGETVGAAVMRGAELVAESDLETLAGELQESFRRWAAEGFLMAVRLDRE